MNLVDLIVAIVVVTILVTVAVGLVTYVAYKLRLARRPDPEQDDGASRYFELHEPPAEPGEASSGSAEPVGAEAGAGAKRP